MKKVIKISERMVFDDTYKLGGALKASTPVKAYKGIILLSLFAFWLTILIDANKSIFMSDLLPVRNFLKVTDFSNEHFNTIILFKFIILSFVFFYTIIKNYRNIYFQKELIKRYGAWFFLYYSLTVSAFGLIVGYHPIRSTTSLTYQYASLVYILLPLFFVNFAYHIYIHILKQKTEPLAYNRVWSLSITLISQALTAALVIAFVLSFTKSSLSIQNNLNRTDGKNNIIINEFIFNNNKVYIYLQQLFSVASSKNLSIIIFGFIGIGVLLVGMNTSEILFIASKQYTYHFFRDQMVILLVVFIAMLLWFIQVLSLTIEIPQFEIINNKQVVKPSLFVRPDEFNSVLGVPNKKDFAYLTNILFSFVILASYLLINFMPKTKQRSDVFQNLQFSFFQTLLWAILVIFDFVNRNSFVALLNIFFTSICSLTMLIVLLTSKKVMNYHAIVFVLITTTSLILVLFSYGVNNFLIVQNNKSFEIIDSRFNFTQIFSILTLVSYFGFLLANSIHIKVVVYRINKLQKVMNEMKKEEVAYEK